MRSTTRSAVAAGLAVVITSGLALEPVGARAGTASTASDHGPTAPPTSAAPIATPAEPPATGDADTAIPAPPPIRDVETDAPAPTGAPVDPASGLATEALPADPEVGPEQADLTVVSPASNSTNEAPAGETPQFPNARVTITGTGEPGATVTGYRGGVGPHPAGQTIVPDGGTWSMSFDAQWTTYPLLTFQQSGAWIITTVQQRTNVSFVHAGHSRDFAVTSTESGATVLAPPGDTPDFPNARVPFVGEGQVDAVVRVVRQNGVPAGSTRVGTDGRWTLDADINWGTWNLRVTSTPPGGAPTSIALNDITIAPASTELPFAVTAPVEGQRLTLPRDGAPGFANARVVFTGTGRTGDAIEVRRLHNGRPAGRTVVGASGNWTLDADYNFGTWGATVLVDGEAAATIEAFTVVEAE